ncbi:hypothetical protein N8D56_00870 [Devosia sp. A8/3-2]|nr:hypothetical protein N8D56_00870 [Devosia sp. A8/3-2]
MLGLPILAADLPVLREVLAPAATQGLAAFHTPNDAAQLAVRVQTMLAQPPAHSNAPPQPMPCNPNTGSN